MSASKVPNYKAIVAADSVLSNVDVMRTQFAEWIARWAPTYGPHIGSGKPADGTPHKDFATGINEACRESGKTAKATEHVRSRVGRTLRVIAAAPKGAEETVDAFHARILVTRTWVTTASDDDIAKRIAGVAKRTPSTGTNGGKGKRTSGKSTSGKSNTPATPPPVTPAARYEAAHNALAAALSEYMTAVEAFTADGGKVTLAASSLISAKCASAASVATAPAAPVAAPTVKRTRKAKVA